MAEQIQNINLNINTRKKFSVDGNPNKIIELDINDINIAKRYADSIERMKSLSKIYDEMKATMNDLNAETVANEDTALTAINKFSEQMGALETEMRDIIDFIFDSPISDTILENTSAFSPVQGKYVKYEQILEVLSNLYTKSIKADMDKINKRNISKYTTRYVKK